MKKLLFIISLLFICSHWLSANTISFDQLSVSTDLTATVYNTNLNTAYNKINSNIDTTNILDDTLDETDMGDNINPRIRTAEGASCQFVYTGLLTTTTSGTLTGSVPSGTAYPLGYRCNKTSSTAKTFTASKWTFVDLDSSCNFQYSEVAIAAATPAVAANSIRISRVSTDGTQIGAVQDLRTTSCSSGSFSGLTSTANEANLDDMLKNGAPMIKRWDTTNQGFQQGLQISWDSGTVFRVKAGSVYVNGKYRSISTDVTATTTTDDPSNGVSGIVSGSVAASTKYNIYAVADQDAVKTWSISYGTSASGLSNYRQIGTITTDAGTLFSSRDIYAINTVLPREHIRGWINFDQTAGAGLQIKNSFNVSSLTDTSAGLSTTTWDNDFDNAKYAVAGNCSIAVTDHALFEINNGGMAAGSVGMTCVMGTTPTDSAINTIVAFGD